jgi:hypothetical protein
MLEPRALLKGAFLGTLTRAAIDRAVGYYWGAKDFVHHLPPALVLPPRAAPPLRRAERYGLADRLVTEVLYGAEGMPGCLLVTTPCRGPYDRTFRSLLVEPHVHDSAHVVAVTRGRPVFLTARRAGSRHVLIAAELSPGSLVLYPAGAPHTFASDEEFQVISLQAAYKEPERRDFAAPSPVRFDRLRRVTYEEFRRHAAVVLLRHAASTP